MQKLIVVLFFQFFFSNFCSFSQTSEWKIANDYFANGKFDSAFDKYQDILKSNHNLFTKSRYCYYFSKFQLAECKRELKDSMSKIFYQNLIKEHWDSLVYKERDKLKKDPHLEASIELLLAKCLYYRNDYRGAVSCFEYCIKNELQLSNNEKYLYAVSLYNMSRYRESQELFKTIDINVYNKKEIDSLLIISKKKFEEKIIDTLTLTLADTLFIKGGVYGCYGHTEIEIKIYTSDDYFYECQIQKISGIDSGYSKIHFHRNQLKLFMDFERKLKLHNYTNGSWCTTSTGFIIKNNNKILKLTFDDGCGMFWGDFKKLLKDISPFD